jgi:hypothetical protein
VGAGELIRQPINPFKSTTLDSHMDIASMETNREFRIRLGELFRFQNLAALSTHHAGQPYASLVAFYAADDFKHIYFVTPKSTSARRKKSADRTRN